MRYTLRSLREEVEKKVEDVHVLNTSFGKHSEQDEELPVLNTFFGNHAEEDKPIAESHEEEDDDEDRVELHHNHLVKHYNDFDKEHKNSIHDYTLSSSMMNSAAHVLDTGSNKAVKSNMTRKSAEVFKPKIDAMDRVVHHKKTPSDLTLYSGIKSSPEHVLKAHGDKSGVVTRTTNFTSTSLSKRKAGLFSRMDNASKHKGYRHMLKIHVPAGHPGAYVAHHSDMPSEKEFILPRNTKMHIEPKPKLDHSLKRAVWTAHVLPHEDK